VLIPETNTESWGNRGHGPVKRLFTHPTVSPTNFGRWFMVFQEGKRKPSHNDCQTIFAQRERINCGYPKGSAVGVVPEIPNAGREIFRKSASKPCAQGRVQPCGGFLWRNH